VISPHRKIAFRTDRDYLRAEAEQDGSEGGLQKQGW
jgi:hypothetical protein